MCPLPRVKQPAGGRGAAQGAQPGSPVLGDALDGRWEAQEGGGTCIHVADPHCATAETNSTVKQSYSSFKTINSVSFTIAFTL